MIHITCTSCKMVLSIDDAFAGGACRCQHCGTIQTVPAKGSAQRSTAAAGKGAKTLFENKARGGPAAGGLDDLADIVASSGLADRRLRKKSSATAAAAAVPSSLLRLLAIAAAVIIVLLLVVLYMVWHASNAGNIAAQTGGTDTDQTINTPVPQPAFPNFCGTHITGQVVVYLVDNGGSSEPVLDSIKSAMFKSIASLGSDRRFQVLFWNPQSDTYPTGTQTAFAVPENVDAAQNKLKDVMAQGSTDPLASMKNALADNPDEIILITAKAGDLEDTLVDKIMLLRGASTVRIDSFAINGLAGDSVLAKLAAKTGGKFVTVPESTLRASGS